MAQEEKPPYAIVLDSLAQNDPEFGNVVAQVIKEASEGKFLDKKTRELIRLALASVMGVKEGVKIHSKEARNLGATKEEIAETLRLVFISAGIPGMYSAINAFDVP